MQDFILNNETDKLQMITKVIDNVNSEISSFFFQNQNSDNVINIKGTWGTGKTTAVKHLEENFKVNSNIHDVNFYLINLWEYETMNNPYIFLIRDLLYKIISNGNLNLENIELSKTKKVTRWFVNLSLQIPYIPFKINAGVENTKMKDIVTDLDSLAKDAINELVEFINKENKKIVIIFDELDRCILDNQIKFLSYIKNIFFEIKKYILFIVACNNNYIDKNLSKNNDNLESYTCKLFNKTLDLNLIIPSHQGRFTQNTLINNFIEEIYNNEQIILSAREITDWLEKINVIFEKLVKNNNNTIVVENKEISIYEKLKNEVELILFFCFYIKNKKTSYYSEILACDINNLMRLNNFDILYYYLSSEVEKALSEQNSDKLELLNSIRKNDDGKSFFSENVVLFGWEETFLEKEWIKHRNKYGFSLFSLLPFLLPLINEETVNNLFIFKKIQKAVITQRSYDLHNYSYCLIISFDYNQKFIFPSLIIFLDMLWESIEKRLKKIQGWEDLILASTVSKFNFENIFNIIKNTIFY